MNTETSRGRNADFTNDLVEAIRDNPLPAALIGAGLVWLFAGSGSLNQIKESASRAGMGRLSGAAAQTLSAQQESVRSGMKAAVDAASSVAPGVANAVSSSVAGLRDGAASMAQTIGSQAELSRGTIAEGYGRTENIVSNVRSNLADLLQRQPLLLGVIGLAIGAGMAASAPITAAEADLLGPSSDTLKQKGGEVAAAVAKAVSDAARSAGEPLH